MSCNSDDDRKVIIHTRSKVQMGQTRLNNLFKGIFVPIINPFTPESDIFGRGTDNLLEYLFSHGIRSVWLLGSYGGFPLLTEKERMRVADLGLKKAKELGMPVIVNVGSLNTDMAVKLTRYAQTRTWSPGSGLCSPFLLRYLPLQGKEQSNRGQAI